ncbi:hypothetical protein KEM55_004282 [Ascosphaera atra]|nr:hypothetical protein KEM55_004282 [Ascosphaera atra]
MDVDIGTRLSYDGSLCTVRYKGEVKGTKGQWLGVEWDDPTRGKHAGEHQGIRYFNCRSRQPTAGSFVRPNRPVDKPRGFLEAMHDKYVSDSRSNEQPRLPGMAGVSHPIQFNGKIAEEVGFDKIRQKLSALQELKIVLLDGLQINGVLSEPVGKELYEQELEKIGETCPKIVDLDLSRNLLMSWKEVNNICKSLPKLKSLRLIGNRFSKIEDGLHFQGVTDLSLDETLLSCAEVTSITRGFPTLKQLSLSSNELTSLSTGLPDSLTELRLEYNGIETLEALRPVSKLPNLTRLSLRGNNISDIFAKDSARDALVFFSTLLALDISFNRIDSWSFIDQLPRVFPGLKTLRISDNPLYMQPPISSDVSGIPEKAMTIDEAYMLTLARIGQLENLNYSHITPNDRQNGELYYLSLIRRELAALPEDQEQLVLQKHPRYAELCKLHGEQHIDRASAGTSSINPRSLAARLVKITFYQPETGESVRKEIPNTLDIYAVKAFVARAFRVPPMTFKLIWETEEWDPIREGDVKEDEWDSEDEMAETAVQKGPDVGVKEKGGQKFVRRQEELVDSTRDIGFWFTSDSREARVRVEMLAN